MIWCVDINIRKELSICSHVPFVLVALYRNRRIIMNFFWNCMIMSYQSLLMVLALPLYIFALTSSSCLNVHLCRC